MLASASEAVAHARQPDFLSGTAFDSRPVARRDPGRQPLPSRCSTTIDWGPSVRPSPVRTTSGLVAGVGS
jgi:hypothetical protein